MMTTCSHHHRSSSSSFKSRVRVDEDVSPESVSYWSLFDENDVKKGGVLKSLCLCVCLSVSLFQETLF